MMSFEFIVSILPQIGIGIVKTLLITVGALSIGLVFGTILGIMQSQGSWIMQKFVLVYATVIRGTPMLIQIVFLYSLLPSLGIFLPPLLTAVVAIGINSSAYVSQIIRAGIKTVSHGQIEAARTLGIKKRDILFSIIVPQAFRATLPMLGNESITLVKDSSLASLIGVMELYNEGKVIISQTYDALSMYVILALIYLTITSCLSYIIHHFEKRYSYAARAELKQEIQ
jgi:His/Glu/Gln/Arg/opine family amino acid ABC transporter permease subunit